MTYLGKEGFACGTRCREKLYRLTVKWTSSKSSSQRLSLHFKNAFYWLLQVYCITQKMHISQEWAFLWVFLKCHETYLFVLFHLKLYMHLTKRNRSNCRFSDLQLLAWKLIKLQLLAWKLIKSRISFFKPSVSFSLNIASPFSVMTHNSPVTF